MTSLDSSRLTYDDLCHDDTFEGYLDLGVVGHARHAIYERE
jgi:hypothetical protein